MAEAEEFEARDEPPVPQRGPVRCAVCGQEFKNRGGLGGHMRTHEPKAPKAPKASTSQGSAPPLRQQIEMVYRLGGQVAVARDLPITGGAIVQSAPACAAAWDDLLDQYFPGVKELLEKGLVAGSVVALIMAHVPIITAARQELAYKAQMREEGAYDPQAGTRAA